MGSTPARSDGPSPVVARLEADWNDIDAAVRVGAEQAECVVVRTLPARTGTERRFELKHVSGRRGELVVATPADPAPDPRPVDLSCRMGALGDHELEERIVARVARRLTDLRGVEFAPIRR